MTRFLLAATVLALAAPLAHAAEPAREAYRQLAAVEAQLDGLRQTLGHFDVPIALDEARREVRTARRRHCQALFRASLVAARDALARGERTRAGGFLRDARRLLPECPFDDDPRDTSTGSPDTDAIARR